MVAFFKVTDLSQTCADKIITNEMVQISYLKIIEWCRVSSAKDLIVFVNNSLVLAIINGCTVSEIFAIKTGAIVISNSIGLLTIRMKTIVFASVNFDFSGSIKLAWIESNPDLTYYLRAISC